MSLMDKDFRPYQGGYYMVSRDGFIFVAVATKGGRRGKFLMPLWQNRCMTYNIRINGDPTCKAASSVVSEVWGEHLHASREITEAMRAEVEAQNRLGRVHKDKIPTGGKPDDPWRHNMACPWASGAIASTPEMDPLTNRMENEGVWVDPTHGHETREAA